MAVYASSEEIDVSQISSHDFFSHQQTDNSIIYLEDYRNALRLRNEDQSSVVLLDLPLISEDKIPFLDIAVPDIEENQNIGDVLAKEISIKLFQDDSKSDEIRGVIASIAPNLLVMDATLHQNLAPTTQLAPLLPTAAPELWADRPSRKSEPAVDFFLRVYEKWPKTPELRSTLRTIDRQLYNALYKSMSDNGIPENLTDMFKKERRTKKEVDAELERLGISDPQQALDPDRIPDRREAERLYASARARLRT